MTTNIIAQVLAALISIESGGDPAAIGDSGRAVGILQMWPIAVDEANRLAGRPLWTYADRRNAQLSLAMGSIILRHHYSRGVSDPVELAARWRNPGGNAPGWYKDKARRQLAAPRR